MQKQRLIATAGAIGLAVLCAAASAAPGHQGSRATAPSVTPVGVDPLTYQKIEWPRAHPTAKASVPPRVSPASASAVRPTWSYLSFGTYIGAQGLVAATVAGSTEVYATASSLTFGSYWYALSKSSTSLSDGLKQTFASEEFASPIVNLSVVRIAGEQRIVVALQDGTLIQYDAASKQIREIASSPCGNGHDGLRAFATGDLNRDGADEFISICVDDMLYAHGPAYAAWSLANVGGSRIALGQMDDDAAIEIVTNAGKVIDSAARKPQWSRATGFGDYLVTGDIDADGRDELITAGGAGVITAYDVETKQRKWVLQAGSDIDALQLADLTGDGVRELLVGDGQWGSVHAYDTTSRVEIGKIDNPDHGVTNMLVTDVNGDGISELLWGAGATSTGPDFLHVATWATKHIDWQNFDLVGPFIGPVAGDLDGDGIDEIVFASRGSNGFDGGGRIIVLDSRTLAVRAVSGPTGDGESTLGIRDIRLGDVDGNGRPDILIATDHGYNGALEAYKFTRKNAFVRTASAYHDQAWSFDTVAAADIDGDGKVEFLGGSTSAIFVFDAATGNIRWSSGVGGDPKDLSIGDLDGDGKLEYTCLAADGKPYVYDGVTRSLDTTIEGFHGTAMSSAKRVAGPHLLVGDDAGLVHEMAFQNGAYVEVKGWPAATAPIDGVAGDASGNVWVGTEGKLRQFDKQNTLRYESVPLGGYVGRQVVRVKGLGLDLTAGNQGLYGLPYTKQ